MGSNFGNGPGRFRRGRRPSREYVPLNHHIRAKRLQVIDHNGENHGEISKEEALDIARSAGLDLFVVSDNKTGGAPIAKILDYGKHKFDEAKKAKQKKKQTTSSVKEIKMRYKIDIGDYNTRLKQSKKFLEKGHKVKLNIVLRGREIQHKNLALDLAEKFLNDLMEEGHSDTPVKMIGRSLILYISPGPDKQRIKKRDAENDTELENS